MFSERNLESVFQGSWVHLLKALATILLFSVTASCLGEDETVELSPFGVDGETDGLGRSYSIESGSSSSLLLPTQNADAGVNDLFTIIPELHGADASAGSFGSVFSSRGMANTPFFGPSVFAMRIDGVPALSPYAYPAELSPWMSTLVYKGAQPSRVGQNAVAGFIDIQTPHPSVSPRRLTAFELGTDSLAKLSLLLQGSLGEEAVNYSFLGYARRMDGGVSNLADPSIGIGGVQRSGARLKLRKEGKGRAFSQFVIAWDMARDEEQPYTPLSGERHTVFKTFEGSTEQSSKSSAFTLGRDLGPARLEWTSSYSDWRIGPYLTQFDLPPLLGSRLNQSSQQWTHDLVLKSSPEMHGDASWEMGLYLEDKDTDGGVFRELVGLFPIEVSEFSLGATDVSLRGRMQHSLDDKWMVGFGVRVSRLENRFRREESVPSAFSTRLQNDSETAQGSVFVQWDASESFQVSGRWHASEKPGGFSVYTNRPEFMVFAPERSRGFEMNGQWDSGDGRHSAVLSLYQSTSTGYQVERSFTETDYFVLNAESAVIEGAELAWQLELDPSLELNFSHAHTNARFKVYRDPFSGDNFAGNQVPYAPEYSSRVEARLALNEGLSLRGSWIFVSDVFFDEANTRSFTAQSYDSGEFWMRVQGKRHSIELGIRNVGDTAFDTYINAGLAQRISGLKRQFAGRFEYAF
ncbi:MAG: TonB-dependent receptor [Symploca sp. SIO2D2]|nr:TonB-dependent receptor [Symploca sp. SIO2D2]